MKSERLLEIIDLLASGQPLTAAMLAAKFGVAKRTILRDMETLGALGIPVVASAGRGGGYGLLPGFTIDRQVLKRDERGYAAAALRGLAGAFGGESGPAGDALRKLSSLDARIRIKPRAKSPDDYLFIDWEPNPKAQRALSLLRGAIEGGQVARIRYVDSEGAESARDVEPLALVLSAQTWYLYAYCRLREGFRMFKLARLREVAILRELAPRRDIDLASRPWKIGSHPDFPVIELRFTGKGRLLAQEYFGEDNLADDGDGLVARAPFPEDAWLYRFILGFGADVEVLAPEHVRARAASLIREAYERVRDQ
jgi:predicted DNA-binding transcriptional regulator YafY